MINSCVKQTTMWIKSFVIKLNLCPFAQREMDKGSVRIQTSLVQSIEDAINNLMTEFDLLNQNAAIETTFLVFPSFLSDFFDYLDFVDIAESALIANDYEGVYQLATFHPNYCFADSNTNDVTNYTNRSPYPMLHILREDSVDKAIEHYGDTEQIPINNKACLLELGLDGVKKIIDGWV